MLPGHCDEATVWKAGRPHHEPGGGPGGRFHFPPGNNPTSWIGRLTGQPLQRNQGSHIAGSRVGGGSRRHRRSTPRSSQESLGPSDASYLDPVKNPLCRVSKVQMVHHSPKPTPPSPPGTPSPAPSAASNPSPSSKGSSIGYRFSSRSITASFRRPATRMRR